jgi:hypothetical protein
VSYYVNGTPVRTGVADIDGRHSIYSNVQAGPDLRLFNEGDTSGVYTHVVYLSSFLFTDRTMSASEIAALGGPKARGILVPAPPINVSIALQGTNVLLNWTGDSPFQLQKTTSLTNISWQNVGSSTNGTNATIPINSDQTFFRVVGQ